MKIFFGIPFARITVTALGGGNSWMIWSILDNGGTITVTEDTLIAFAELVFFLFLALIGLVSTALAIINFNRGAGEDVRVKKHKPKIK